jgi:hypothetical protein
MNFFDKLTTLFKIENNFPKLSSVAIHFLHDITIGKIIHVENHTDNRRITININASQLNKKQEIALQKIIKEAVEQEDKLLLEDNAKKLLDNFENEEKNEESIEIINFFRNKIPTIDLEILRAALYIKGLYEQKAPVNSLKTDIIYKYGDRGRNIVNLCSAGYFISYIKPLYEEMESQVTFSNDKFLDVYDTIIKYSAFSIFVNREMTLEVLLKKVNEQIEFNKRYGINHSTLHGIGHTNITKIQDVLTKIANKFTSLPEIESTNQYISATIFF